MNIIHRIDEGKAVRNMQLLRQENANKDIEIMEKNQENDRLRDRVSRLEQSLGNAMADLGRKSESIDKWEFKAGALQQQLNELERFKPIY